MWAETEPLEDAKSSVSENGWCGSGVARTLMASL